MGKILVVDLVRVVGEVDSEPIFLRQL